MNDQRDGCAEGPGSPQGATPTAGRGAETAMQAMIRKRRLSVVPPPEDLDCRTDHGPHERSRPNEGATRS